MMNEGKMDGSGSANKKPFGGFEKSYLNSKGKRLKGSHT